MFTQKKFLHLLKLGAIKEIGLDSDGDEIYMITKKCQHIDPESFRHRVDTNGLTSMELWHTDLCDIIFTDEDIVVRLKPEAYDISKTSGLSFFSKLGLEKIKNMLEET